MALLWMDGFDHYVSSSTNFGTLFTGVYLSTTGQSVVMPELGTRGYSAGSHGNNSGNISGIVRPITSKSSGLLGTGAHVYSRTLRGYLAFAQNGTNSIRYSCGPDNTTGEIIVRQGNTEIGRSDSSFIDSSTLYHIEMQVRFHASEGEIEVRVNGVTAVLVSGLNTSAVPITGVGLTPNHGGGISAGSSYDNWYIYDETGDVNNDWLGERNIYTLFPDEDLSPQDWTLSTGSDAWDLINNVPTSSQYIEAETVGDISRFGLTDLPSTDISIIGVSLWSSASKTGTSDSTYTYGVVGHPSAPVALTQDQFLYDVTVMNKNPNTTDDWEPGEINSLEIEFERTL